MNKNMHSGHRERMRKRFFEEGGESFADHELVEMLLYGALPMRDTNALAHRLIDEFGSLQALLEADAADIMQRCNVSGNVVLLLSLQKELRRRLVLAEWGERPVIDSVQKAGAYAMNLLAHMNYERAYLICLDAGNRLRKTVMISEGTVSEAALYPRKIVEEALKHQATSVILAHNHPNGVCRPSFSDVENTDQIRRVLKMIGIRLSDHIIVSGDQYFSFAAKKLLYSKEEEQKSE